MPPINLLIKPASGNCNLRCSYCFYSDIIDNRATKSYGIMSLETLESIVAKVFSVATGSCNFAFQGGEPTLAGLDFFKKLIELQKRYNTKGIAVNNSIQTNGICIDEQWAEFFYVNKFLVGLSLDGNKDIHDIYRLDYSGNGSYKTVMQTVMLFNRYKVEYNTLTVITSHVAKRVDSIYSFYKRNGFLYQQYIPCLDPQGEPRGQHMSSLTPKLYAQFLKTLFDLWYRDVKRSEFVYIRYFDNLVGMVKGYPPENCGMAGFCARQLVVEADGGVYPCDFYVLDEYKIGNLVTDSFEKIEENRLHLGFVEQSRVVDESCRSCEHYPICRGGCRRDRDFKGKLERSYFCEAYKEFFPYVSKRLIELAKMSTMSN